MLLLSHLGSETIAEIRLEDEEKEEENEDWGKACSSAQCQSIITGTECHFGTCACTLNAYTSGRCCQNYFPDWAIITKINLIG